MAVNRMILNETSYFGKGAIQEVANEAKMRGFKKALVVCINYICLFDYLFISSQMSAKPYFIGSTGILLLW
ncbi:hypothetical protein ABE870_19250 [Enterococcus avium]|uniref:hypothetical protein n=1 Tax=Enterococcus avium TaxID=33945 RepID=UPI003D6B1F6D